MNYLFLLSCGRSTLRPYCWVLTFPLTAHPLPAHRFPISDFRLISCLSVTPDYILAGGYLFQCHRAAGMKFLCGDTYLGTKTELCSVGEGSRCIVVDAGGIHFKEEAVCGTPVLCYDTLAMS